MKNFYFLILLFLIFPHPVFAGSEYINSAKDGVVCVVVYDAENNIVSWGTGFAIGIDKNKVKYIATNNHVVENSTAKGNSLRVFYAANDNNSVAAKILTRKLEKDLAILELSTPIRDLTALVLEKSNNVQTAEYVYALGFPGDTFDPDTISGFNRTDITILNGIISNKLIQNNQKTYQISISISPGFSGGPLVNDKGQVVGVNTRRLNNNKNIGYAIANDELMTILDENGILYITPQKLFRKNLSLTLILTSVALLLFVVVFIMIKFMKKKQLLNIRPIVNNHKTKQVFANTEIATAYIYCLTGEMANSKFGLKSGTLLFGKNSEKCNILFKVDSDNISEEHCQIKASGENEFFLIDLDSIRGTYLNNKKIEPFINNLLKNGDVFFLANEQNMFKIRYEQHI